MKKRILAVLLLCVFGLCVCSASSAETRGFDTPEACALAVAQALIAGDAQAFLDCYAIAETARNFDLAAHTEWYRSLAIGNTLLQPASGFDIAYNEARFTGDLLQRVAGAALMLGNPDMDSIWGTLMHTGNHTVEEMVALADTGDWLSRLTVQGEIRPAQADEHYDEHFAKRYAVYCDVYGMEQWQETIVLLDLEGRAVMMPLALVRYDTGWLAAPFPPLIGMMKGMPTYSLLIPEDMALE